MGTGSLIGVLVGALGGPIGMLLGLGVGALAGAAVDTDRAESDELAVTAFVGKLAPGTNGILAQTSEPGSTAPLDAVVAEQGGTIVRRPLNEVLAEPPQALATVKRVPRWASLSASSTRARAISAADRAGPAGESVPLT